MLARTNRRKLELLGGDPDFYEPNSEPVPDLLVGKLKEGFKKVDGCVVPSSFAAPSISTTESGCGDETGLECSLTKVYLEEFIAADLPLSELARVGVAYGMYLRKALLDSPVSGQFRIIVDAQIPDPDLQVGNACSVRFHKVRPDQEWLVSDL